MPCNIPFKGSAEAVTEVLAGRVDYYFSPIAPVIGQIKEGQLLALAVGSPRRATALPDVPTTAEAGVPGSEFNFWIGMMAPAKTPRDIVNRLQRRSGQSAGHARGERALCQAWAPMPGRSSPSSSTPTSRTKSKATPCWSKPPACRRQ